MPLRKHLFLLTLVWVNFESRTSESLADSELHSVLCLVIITMSMKLLQRNAT